MRRRTFQAPKSVDMSVDAAGTSARATVRVDEMVYLVSEWLTGAAPITSASLTRYLNADQLFPIGGLSVTLKRGVDPLVGCQRPGLLPNLGSHHSSQELIRLIGDAGPEEDFIRAVAFLGANGLAQEPGFGGAPDLREGFFPQVSKGGVVFADAYISIG